MSIPQAHLDAITALQASAGPYRDLVAAMQAAAIEGGETRFVQFGWTHETPVPIDAPAVSDRLDWYPGDRSEDHALGALFAEHAGAALPFRARCDEWVGAGSMGWNIVVQTVIGGVTYQYEIPGDEDGVGAATEPVVIEDEA